MPICRKCQKQYDNKELGKCPNCGAETQATDNFLRTQRAHKDWYNVKGKLGKQRGKFKQDMNSKNEKKK